ncbi:MAG: helix-turn-helix transcriptional regulator [Deinococcota bacterium]|jgi:DNA-binding Xre family transcriptional regulator|nr:helix-turn-helix transcriptional regulator [Deinococcota bacterium]
MDKMRWKVKEVLEANDLNTFALVNKTHGKLSHNTVYALARGEPKRIALETLQEVIEALSDLTGRPVNVQDLLEYAPEPQGDELGQDAPQGAHEVWRSLEGLLDDPAFDADSVNQIDADLSEAQEREFQDSLAGRR